MFLESLELQWLTPVSGKCLRLVFSQLFEERPCRLLKRLSWRGGEGRLRLHTKKIATILLASFHSRLKSFNLRWFFIWRIFLSNQCFSASNFVSTQPCPQGFFNFFDMESKRSARTILILLILTLWGTSDISLQWWLLIRSKFFSNFSNRKTPSY